MSPFFALLASAVEHVEEGAHAAAEQAAEHGAAVAEHGAAAAEHHGEAHGPAEILMHHVLDQPFLGMQSKHLVFFLLAAAIVILVAQLARRRYKAGGVPTGLGAAVELLVIFVRDDLAEKNIGHDGRKFTPLLCSFFFFILVAALMGLMPFSATSTGNLAVTLALATISSVSYTHLTLPTNREV